MKEFALSNDLLLHSNLPVIQLKQASETAEFWNYLGGKGRYPYDDDSIISSPVLPRLFHCTLGTGTFDIYEILNYSQDDLDTHDVFILDAFHAIFVWFGKRSSDKEHRWSMEAVMVRSPPFLPLPFHPLSLCMLNTNIYLNKKEYVKCAPTPRKANLPIWRVKEGEEPYLFTTLFHAWMVKNKVEQPTGIDGGLDSVPDLLNQYDRKYTYEEIKNGQFSKALDTANLEVCCF